MLKKLKSYDLSKLKKIYNKYGHFSSSEDLDAQFFLNNSNIDLSADKLFAPGWFLLLQQSVLLYQDQKK